MRFVVDLIACVLCSTGALVTLAHLHDIVTPFVILAGAVLGCGWAVTGWLDGKDAAYAASLAIAAGIALVILVSLVSIELAWWHPTSVVGVMLALAAVSNVGIAYRDARRWSRS